MACECNVAVIERECGRNAASIKPTWKVSCEDEITSIGAATDHSVSTITMRAAAAGPPEVTAGKFYAFAGSRKDADLKTTQDPETGVFTTEAKLFIPKQASAKAVILNNLGEDNNIIIVQDMNGAKRIIGEMGNPANITVEETTNPKNGYTLTLTWQSGYSPYFFTGTEQE